MALLKPKKIRQRLSELKLPEQSKLKAVAIKYDVKKDNAPRIMAAGRGLVADQILKLADEHNVPFCEDPDLVALLSKLQFDYEIPPELYSLVAEVLAFVYELEKLNKKKKQRGAQRKVKYQRKKKAI